MGTTAQFRFTQVWPDGRETTEAVILVNRDGGHATGEVREFCEGLLVGNGNAPGHINGVGRLALEVAAMLKRATYDPELIAYDPNERWDYELKISAPSIMDEPVEPECSHDTHTGSVEDELDVLAR